MQLDPLKQVAHFSDISNAANSILAKIKEPRLEGKLIAPGMVKPELFPVLHKLFLTEFAPQKNYSLREYDFINAFSFRSTATGQFIVFLKKHREVVLTLRSYFHEVGHIANYEFNCKKGLFGQDQEIVAEMLAESFWGWAAETFNTMGFGFYYPSLEATLAKSVEQMTHGRLENNMPEIRATKVSLLMAYVMNGFKSAQELYHYIQKSCDEEKPPKIIRI